MWEEHNQHILTMMKKGRNCRMLASGTYFGMRDARFIGCWNCSFLRVTVAILKLIPWQTGSQCRSERTGVIRQNQGFWATTRARIFWTSWRRVGFETMCQPGESCRNQLGSQLYCCSYGFRSLSSKRSTNVTQGTNMEITSLACFRHLLIKGHNWAKDPR